RTARELGRRLLHEGLRRGLPVSGPRPLVPISMSVGVATASGAEHADEVVRRASEAQWLAATNGGQVVVAYGEQLAKQTATVNGLLEALSSKMPDAREQARQVAHYALLLAKAVELPKEQHLALKIAALLHDIGNLVVPDALLHKASELTAEELAVVREHVHVSRRILEASPPLAPAATAAFAHHEHWDGSGYPCGLKGDEIPVSARILSVADAYVTIRAGRASGNVPSHADAIRELRAAAGTRLDSRLVDAFVQALDTESALVA
ncbi:MAG TPA: HD domain-containing phosphohydrolase, partial [Dehalococcoidia bacterium]|nr:HD domain-containing phosphohydrolase [Dehalococcoidia bacterium]